MDSIELLFRIGADTTALDKLLAAQKAVGVESKLTSTEFKLFDTVLRQLAGTGDNAKAVLDNLAKSKKTLGIATSDAAKEALNWIRVQERAATAAAEAARNIDKVSAAARHSVTDVQAAGAAIRGLEGSLNVRAVEQFATKFLGLGSIAQAAFPVFGAVAFIEIIGRGIEKLGEMYNAWNPIIRAEKQAIDKLKEYSSEAERAERKIRDLEDKDFERKYGRAALLKRQADYTQGNAVVGQADISDTQARITALEVRIKAGTTPASTYKDVYGITHTIAESRTYDSRAAEVTRNSELEHLDVQRKQLQENKLDVSDKKAESAKISSDEALSRLEKIYGITNRVGQEHANALASQLGPIGSIQARGAQDIGSTINELTAAGAPQSTVDEQRKKLEEVIRIKVEEELAKLIGSFPTGSNGRPVYKDAPSGSFAGDQWRFDGYRNRSKSSLPDVAAQGDGEFLGLRSKEFSKGLARSISDDSKSTTTDKQTFDAYIREEQKQVEAQANRTLKLLSLQNGPGGQGRSVEQSYQVRLDLAEKLFDITARKINIEVEAANQTKALDEARIKRDDERFQAEQEHILQLAELQRKAQDDARNQIGKLFDVATSRNPSQSLQQLLIGEGKGFGRTILQNVAAKPLTDVERSVAGVLPSSGPVHALIQGTILDSTKYGDSQRVTADNTGKIITEVKNTNKLLSGKTSSDGSSFMGDASGSAPNIPFLPSSLSPDTQAVLNAFNPAGVSSFSASSASGSGGGILAALSGGLKSFGNGANIFAKQGYLGLQDAITGDSGGTGAERAGVIASAAGAGVTAAIGIIGGIKQGGVGGFSKSAASALGLAGALAGPTPVGAALDIAALGASVIGAIFGQNPQKREAKITKYLAESQFIAPVSRTASTDISGHYVDYGANGQLRTSSLSPYSTVQDPYVQRYNAGFFNVPGQTTSPGGGQMPQIVINQNNSMLDPTGINGMGPMLASSVQKALMGGQADGLATVLKGRLLPGG